MAIENKVFLNGQIQRYRKVLDEDKKILRIAIGLLVIRRPDVAVGNKRGNVKTDVVLIYITDEPNIEYLEKHNVTEGDFLEVYGVFCTSYNKKTFTCKSCGKKNSFEGSISYVYPLYIKADEIHPKNHETIILSEMERLGTLDDISNILLERKTFPGDIIAKKDLGQGDDGNYRIRITVREKITETDKRKWFNKVSEISNHILLIGSLCRNPSINPNEKGGRVCSYQIAINRKVYIAKDPPNTKTDYPWIKSLGDQATKDNDALRTGSLVYIDGSIQARDAFHVEKECDFCGNTNTIRGEAMEIVPYAVEYLRNFNELPSDDELEELEDLENEDTETEEGE